MSKTPGSSTVGGGRTALLTKTNIGLFDRYLNKLADSGVVITNAITRIEL